MYRPHCLNPAPRRGTPMRRLLLMCVALVAVLPAAGRAAPLGDPPAYRALPKPESAESLVVRGKTAYNAGDYGQAASLFLRAHQREPREARHVMYLARALFYAERYRRALEAYELHRALAPPADAAQLAAERKSCAKLAARLRPKAPPEEDPRPDLVAAMTRASEAGNLVGPQEGAWAFYERWLEAGALGPQLAEARADLGAALQQALDDVLARYDAPDRVVEPGEPERCAAYVDRLLNLRVAEPAAALAGLRGQRSFCHGLRHLAAQHPDLAVKAFRSAEQTWTADPRPALGLSTALLAQNDPAGALAAALRAGSRAPGDPRAAVLQAAALSRQGQPAAAIDALRQALRAAAAGLPLAPAPAAPPGEAPAPAAPPGEAPAPAAPPPPAPDAPGAAPTPAPAPAAPTDA